MYLAIVDSASRKNIRGVNCGGVIIADGLLRNPFGRLHENLVAASAGHLDKLLRLSLHSPESREYLTVL